MINEYRELVKNANEINKKAEDKVVVSRYLRGEKYESSEIKLLVIGRAINGWSNDFIVDNADELLSMWEKQERGELECLSKTRFLDKGKTPISLEETKGLEWVKTYIKSNKNYCRTETQSRFWSVVRATTEALYQNNLKKGEWTKHIAWTNLAKLAPVSGGNPKGDNWRVQIELAPKILEKELKELEPTHILVIAKTSQQAAPQEDSWIKPFYDVLNEYKEKNNIKVAYMCRPEFKGKKEYLNEVYNALDIDKK